jgi:hypothetical protein
VGGVAGATTCTVLVDRIRLAGSASQLTVRTIHLHDHQMLTGTVRSA